MYRGSSLEPKLRTASFLEGVVVGERCQRGEAISEGVVERWEVRMPA